MLAIDNQNRKLINFLILDVVVPVMGSLEAAIELLGITPSIQVTFLKGYDPSQRFNDVEVALERC